MSRGMVMTVVGWLVVMSSPAAGLAQGLGAAAEARRLHRERLQKVEVLRELSVAALDLDISPDVFCDNLPGGAPALRVQEDARSAVLNAQREVAIAIATVLGDTVPEGPRAPWEACGALTYDEYLTKLAKELTLTQYLSMRETVRRVAEQAEKLSAMLSPQYERVSSCCCCSKPSDPTGAALLISVGGKGSRSAVDGQDNRVDLYVSTNILAEGVGALIGGLGKSALGNEIKDRVSVEAAFPVVADEGERAMSSGASILLATGTARQRWALSAILQTVPRALADTSAPMIRGDKEKKLKSFTSPGLRFSLFDPDRLSTSGDWRANWVIGVDVVFPTFTSGHAGTLMKNVVLADPPQFNSWDRWVVSIWVGIWSWKGKG